MQLQRSSSSWASRTTRSLLRLMPSSGTSTTKVPNTGHRHRLDLPLGAQTTEQLQADAAELLSWNQKIKALTGYRPALKSAGACVTGSRAGF